MGLSPYTRGNHCLACFSIEDIWSIPVHTGKPVDGSMIAVSAMVYPRTHGETLADETVRDILEGLSPYTRGNPYALVNIALSNGSIPVHTGKPVAVKFSNRTARVYPRTHGETLGF